MANPLKRVLAVLTIALLEDDEVENRPKKRRCWVKPWIAARNLRGAFNCLLEELRLEDKESYRRFLRMDEDTFCFLSNLIKPKIQKMDTNYRRALTPEEKLAITLRFLASGETQWSLALQFRVSQSAISKFIQHVCTSIYMALQPKYLQLPATQQEWKTISTGFEKVWNFPHCLGAIDGKHVAIRHPPGTGSNYFNYKKFFSVVLMAVVSHDLNFIYIDIGSPGRFSDGGIWSNCSLNKAILTGNVILPKPSLIHGFEKPLTYSFVADEAFPLKMEILRPYPGDGLNNEKRIFNYRLSRAHRIVENAFGILASTWSILQKPIAMDPERVSIKLMCICVLHNLLRSKSSTRNITTPSGSLDVEDPLTGEVLPGSWRSDASNNLQGLQTIAGQRAATGPIRNRDMFTEYFNSVGAIPWQDKVLGI